MKQISSLFQNITLVWQASQLNIAGTLSHADKLLFQSQLSNVAGLNIETNWLDRIIIRRTENTVFSDQTIIRAILDLNIAKINLVSITFAQSKSVLSAQALVNLIDIKDQFNILIETAE